MLVKNTETGIVADFGEHPLIRWNEDMGGGDVVAAFKRALPFGVQLGNGNERLLQDGEAVFVIKKHWDGSGWYVKTVLTLEQATLNMQTFIGGARKAALVSQTANPVFEPLAKAARDARRKAKHEEEIKSSEELSRLHNAKQEVVALDDAALEEFRQDAICQQRTTSGKLSKAWAHVREACEVEQKHRRRYADHQSHSARLEEEASCLKLAMTQFLDGTTITVIYNRAMEIRQERKQERKACQVSESSVEASSVEPLPAA